MTTYNKLILKTAKCEHGLNDVGAVKAVDTVCSEHACLKRRRRRIIDYEVPERRKAQLSLRNGFMMRHKKHTTSKWYRNWMINRHLDRKDSMTDSPEGFLIVSKPFHEY